MVEHNYLTFGSPASGNSEEEKHLASREQLESLVKALNSSVDTECLVAQGSIKAEVIAAAQQLNCDLIVVGCHGHHGSGLLFGGNASAILHKAPCDVMAIYME